MGTSRGKAEAWRATPLSEEFLATATVEEALGALAELQHLVFHLAQLEAIGLSRSAVWNRAARSRLYPVHRAVYSLAPPGTLSNDGRRLAAVLACGPSAALGLRDAASLHELRRNGRNTIDVVLPGGSHRRHPGIDVHRSRTLTPADITRVRNIPVSTIARTILDLAEVLTPRELERVLEQAEVLEVFDLGALHEQVVRNPTRPAAARLAAVLGGWEVDLGAVWSAFEARLDDALRLAGIPRPRRNEWIVPDDGGVAIRPDLQWPEQRLVVQADGWRFHRSRASFERNTRDDQRLMAAGWLPLRLTWRQLRDERDRLVATILRLVRERTLPSAGR